MESTTNLDLFINKTHYSPIIEARVQAAGIKTIVRTSIIDKPRNKVKLYDGGKGMNDSRTLNKPHGAKVVVLPESYY